MLHLSSGRLVDLSTDRARFHALQQNGPAPDATHRALYKLVDVVYRHRDEEGTPLTGWTEHSYSFSGYTLVDIYTAPDWSAEEKSELFQWVAQQTQKLKIETCRRRLVKEQSRLSIKNYFAPDSLYSRLLINIRKLPLKSACADQWLSTIQNFSGIRQEEIYWSGINTFLTSQKSNTILARRQIIDAINFDNIKIALSAEKIFGHNGGLNFFEVAQRMPHQVVYRATLKLDSSCQCILRYQDQSYNYRVGVVKTNSNTHHMSLNRYWFAFDPYGRAITNQANNTLFFNNSETARNAATSHAKKQLGLKQGMRFRTHYDHLTLFGGDNYREWLVSLPGYQRIFFGAHYIDHNILAHIRTTTRQDAQNRKILFIEELQSDWHQNGQVHGYDNRYWGRVADAPFKKEWVSLAVKLMLVHASQNGFDGISWVDGDIQERRYSKKLLPIKRHYDVEIPKTLNRLGKPFQCQVQRTTIRTRDPWLNLVKTDNKWGVKDGNGKFETRNRYESREQAMMVLHCNCKAVDLPVSVFVINDALRQQIADKGLPMFGEVIDT